jgi:hypothetical protein
MDNILNDFLGLDIVQLKNISEDNLNKNKEIAVAITKLTEYPEWKVFAEELNRMLSVFDKGCEYYALNPNQAWCDMGQKRSLQIIQRFVEKQNKVLEQYGKTQENT